MRGIADTILLRIRSEEDDSEEREAAKEILELLLEEGGMEVPEIHAKLDHGSEVIDGAILLLEDLGLGDFKRKNLNGGER